MNFERVTLNIKFGGPSKHAEHRHTFKHKSSFYTIFHQTWFPHIFVMFERLLSKKAECVTPYYEVLG